MKNMIGYFAAAILLANTAKPTGEQVLNTTGYFSWDGNRIEYQSQGGRGGGIKSTTAVSGDYEVVVMGSQGGPLTHPSFFDENLLKGQHFRGIASGDADKRAEFWIRENTGQSNITLPSHEHMQFWSILVVKGNSTMLNLDGLKLNRQVPSSGEFYYVPSLDSYRGFTILAYYHDDPREITNVGNGIMFFQDWDLDDGTSAILYNPGVVPPKTVPLISYAGGGRQYVGVIANIPVVPLLTSARAQRGTSGFVAGLNHVVTDRAVNGIRINYKLPGNAGNVVEARFTLFDLGGKQLAEVVKRDGFSTGNNVIVLFKNNDSFLRSPAGVFLVQMKVLQRGGDQQLFCRSVSVLR